VCLSFVFSFVGRGLWVWLGGQTLGCAFGLCLTAGSGWEGAGFPLVGAYILSPIEREAGQNPCTRTRTCLRQRNRAPGSRRRSGEEFSFLFNSLPRSISKQNYGPGGVHRVGSSGNLAVCLLEKHLLAECSIAPELIYSETGREDWQERLIFGGVPCTPDGP